MKHKRSATKLQQPASKQIVFYTYTVKGYFVNCINIIGSLHYNHPVDSKIFTDSLRNVTNYI